MSAGDKDQKPVLFFDAGGTLIYPVKPIGRIYSEVAEKYGMQVDPERLDYGFRTAWKGLKPRDPEDGARAMDDRKWWFQVVKRTWEVVELREGFRFDDYFDELYAEFAKPSLWKVFPEVRSCLQKLRRAKVRCAVMSNWDRRLRRILKGLKLDVYFETLIISSEVGVEKPHPKIFQLALDRMNIGPERAVLIGDDAENDLNGARQAGWKGVLVERPERDIQKILEEL